MSTLSLYLSPFILILTVAAMSTTCTAREQTETGYDQDFIDLVEMIYGEGYLSQGGPEHTLQILEGIELDGKQVLELGSGLGGPALAVAQHHRAHVTGTDPEAIMIAKSRAAMAKQQDCLAGTVTFEQMESPLHLKQFPDNHFDVIYSIESLLHVPLENKHAYYQEIYRVLKPGGTFAVLDWMQGDTAFSRDTQRMMEMDGVAFHLLTQPQYEQLLQDTHFTGIEYSDSTKRHEDYSLANVDTVLALKDQIVSRFDDQTYFYSLESWAIQRKAFANNEIRTGLFRARKPSI